MLAFRAPAPAAAPFVTLRILPWHPRREFLAGTPIRRLLAWVSPRRRRWLRELRQFEKCRYEPPADSLVIAVSRMVADDLNAWHGVAAERIRLVPNGVDISRFFPPGLASCDRWRRHFNVVERFLTEYESRFERDYGFFRSIVKEVVDKYLDCSNLRCGFARIRCPDCAEERLVMFSCRTRGFCPSCHAKRINHPDLWGPDQSTHAPPFSGDRGRDRRGGRLP